MEINQAFSPTPKPHPAVGEVQVIPMDFFRALKEVAIGKKIHKIEWENREFYGMLKDGIVVLHKPDGKFYQWIISDGDLTGTDYIIL